MKLLYVLNLKTIKKIKNLDWKKMGFETEKEYKDFLKMKMDSLLSKIENTPELLNVLKRLKDK